MTKVKRASCALNTYPPVIHCFACKCFFFFFIFIFFFFFGIKKVFIPPYNVTVVNFRKEMVENRKMKILKIPNLFLLGPS